MAGWQGRREERREGRRGLGGWEGGGKESRRIYRHHSLKEAALLHLRVAATAVSAVTGVLRLMECIRARFHVSTTLLISCQHHALRWPASLLVHYHLLFISLWLVFIESWRVAGLPRQRERQRETERDREGERERERERERESSRIFSRLRWRQVPHYILLKRGVTVSC